MGYKVTLNQEEILKMDPIELAETLMAELNFVIPDEIVSKAGNKQAGETITKATAFQEFFMETETKAKLLKRKAKADKNKEEAERYMGIEDVCKTCKEATKIQIENVAKLMTLRRLELEEQKQNGNIT